MSAKITIIPLKNINEIHVQVEFALMDDYGVKEIIRWQDAVQLLRDAKYKIGDYCMNGGVACNYNPKLLSHTFKFAHEFAEKTKIKVVKTKKEKETLVKIG